MHVDARFAETHCLAAVGPRGSIVGGVRRRRGAQEQSHRKGPGVLGCGKRRKGARRISECVADCAEGRPGAIRDGRNRREAGQAARGGAVLPGRDRHRPRPSKRAHQSRPLELAGPALAKHPDDAELLTVRAAARLQLKDSSGAEQDARRAVDLAPTNADAVAVLAGIYSSAGAGDKPQALLEQTIQRVPGNIDLRLALAQINSQNHRTAELEALLLKIIELDPKERAHRMRLAQLYAASRPIDAAERTGSQGIAALPDDHPIKLSLIDFLSARRGREVAEKELKGMVAAAPSDHELQFALAKFYGNEKETPQAEAVYRSIIKQAKLEPSGLEARDRLAQSLAARNDLDGA